MIPFICGFHGYPSHYQNYTLPGHTRLFERNGFRVRSLGTCVGPTVALVDIGATFLQNAVPTWLLSRTLSNLFRIAALPFKALDLLLNPRHESHVIAATTFVLAEKQWRTVG